MAVFSGAAQAKAPSRKYADAHSDFVFAVAGEEFGLFVCLIIVGLFAFIVLRGFTRALQETDLFILLATAGLLVQFGLQAVINMGSTLRLMPTKGMTLPFVSYGGSSLIAMGLCIGFPAGADAQARGREVTVMTNNRHIMLAAGGTGRHIFPAIAVAEALISRGYTVSLITDERGMDLGSVMPEVAVHQSAHRVSVAGSLRRLKQCCQSVSA